MCHVLSPLHRRMSLHRSDQNVHFRQAKKGPDNDRDVPTDTHMCLPTFSTSVSRLGRPRKEGDGGWRALGFPVLLEIHHLDTKGMSKHWGSMLSPSLAELATTSTGSGLHSGFVNSAQTHGGADRRITSKTTVPPHSGHSSAHRGQDIQVNLTSCAQWTLKCMS